MLSFRKEQRYHFDESKFDDFDTAKTVYIGAGKSGLSYRFYDKDKEVCSKHNKTLEEVGSWKRTEMQLRDDTAHAFAMTFKDRPLELGELALGLLANNLRLNKIAARWPAKALAQFYFY